MSTISIQSYTDLIKMLPVADQAFTVKASNWEKRLSENHYTELFKGEKNICISRQDIRNTSNPELLILKTILWGYPKGMRGNNIENIYKQLDKLTEILADSNTATLKIDDVAVMQNQLSKIKGLGLSTYSKLLYFSDFRFGNLSFYGGNNRSYKQKKIPIVFIGIFNYSFLLIPPPESAFCFNEFLGVLL